MYIQHSTEIVTTMEISSTTNTSVLYYDHEKLWTDGSVNGNVSDELYLEKQKQLEKQNNILEKQYKVLEERDKARQVPNEEMIKPLRYKIQILKFMSFLINAVLSTIAMFYGIMTWIILAKSRTFNNYVYLNVIVAKAFSFYFTLDFHDVMVSSVRVFTLAGLQCWLSVALVLIYLDIVVVFWNDLQRKYLLSNLYAWGVPALFVIGGQTLDPDAHFGRVLTLLYWFSLVMVVTEILLYLRVLYCLIRGNNVRYPSKKCQNLQVALVTLFLGGTPYFLLLRMSQTVNSISNDVSSIMFLTSMFLAVTIDIVYLMLKCNRRLWLDKFSQL